jgi:serine protease Do
LRLERAVAYDPTMPRPLAPARASRDARASLVLLAWLTAGPGPAAAAEAPLLRPEPARPAAVAPSPGDPATPASAAAGGPFCAGEYADDLGALTRAAREFDRAQKPYTFCIRTSAVYECPYYSSDGALRRIRKRVMAHGTAFGFRREGADALVITNEHVAEWPAVTDREHVVDGVPSGCRRMSDAVRIVDDESDAFDRDDIPLARVVADPQADISVLRARAPLPVMPWRVGRSAALRERNAVDVRGFPLGVLRTTNVGKVTSAYEHDSDRDWDHDDFVIDALLSPGNSGSPVFAVSCRTGEFELVGVYHAGYVRGSALNVVVGIDQLRELLETLKRPPRPRAEVASAPLDLDARTRVADWARSGPAGLFPFGAVVAAAVARPDGALVFALMGRDYPVRSVPVLVVEDLPPEGEGFGRLGRVWAGNGSALRAVERAALEADSQAHLARLLDALRRDAGVAAAFRAAARAQVGSRERFEAVARMERGVRKLAETRAELAQNALDLADRLTGSDGELGLELADVLAAPVEPAPPAAPPGVAPAATAAKSAAGVEAPPGPVGPAGR